MLSKLLKRPPSKRFADLVNEEVDFFLRAHGDRAMEQIAIEIARPEIRSRYRAVLQAAEQVMKNQAAASANRR